MQLVRAARRRNAAETSRGALSWAIVVVPAKIATMERQTVDYNRAAIMTPLF
jgi:hypothetical protein